MSSAKINSFDNGYHYLFKLVLAGSSGVGKTSMLMRYVDETFSNTFISTIGVDFKVKTEAVDEALVKLQMWDTAGQDRFKSVASNFYRCADAIIIVFDVCSATSFTEVEGWVSEARRYGPAEFQGLLVGNKADGAGDGDGVETSGRQVDEAQAKELANRLGMTYIETSAKTGLNIAEAFRSLAKKMVSIKRQENGGEDPIRDNNSFKQGSVTLGGGKGSRPVNTDGSGGWDPCGWNRGSCSTL